MVLALVLPSRLNDFSVVFVSIIPQSLPFLLVGVFASAFVQQYLSEGVLTRWLPRQRLLLVLVSSVFGFLAPVCDCGVIPLARRQAGVAARDHEQTDRPRVRSTMSDGVSEQGELLGCEGVAPHHGWRSRAWCRARSARDPRW